MQAKLGLLWASLVVLLLLPGLACSVAWALAVRPAPTRGLTLPLAPGRTLQIELYPCVATEPGRLLIWFVDTTNANRFVRERFMLLVRAAVASPCP